MSKADRDLPDSILLKKHLLGNADAYNILFKRYYDSLFRYTLKNVDNYEVAEELIMDVMLRLWQMRAEITIDTDLRPYLQRSVKNAIYNHHRKKILATISIDQIIPEIIQTSATAEDKVKYIELEKLYKQKLNELSPQRQKVFRMSREENMTYPQIAKHLDLSVNTVENYMVASLSFFRKHLKEYTDQIVLLVITLLFF
ncbi:RNA polymerase sigma-70 factor, ECF subfamily [Mucilaginibacter pineti]|uniref:RNA polymerase sigma-70 factor, ECF subfamily n=1 Tax=Mucilaginibacter pineti TaxID=1391627 RepID=A0A1G7M1Q3_9SPHI|nr:sigma-70 family RNA polymerase sigma factor [Mucilaginibacter pineti]SDF55677.1 RNA polymerase sigma-70 factor, ECF subfamily [Mucilaginibacter pineti]